MEAWGEAKRSPRNWPHHGGKLRRSAEVDSGDGTRPDSSAAPKELARFLHNFLGFRFASPQAVILARLWRLRASVFRPRSNFESGRNGAKTKRVYGPFPDPLTP